MNDRELYILAHEKFNYIAGKLFWIKDVGIRIKAGAQAGCFNKKAGYRRVGIARKYYFEHRIIFLMHRGYLPEFIDHADNNKLNNNIENLRSCTLSENQCNKRAPRTNTSGVKGVTRHKQSGKWQCQIRYKGKNRYLGYFEDLELAELVVSEARDMLHGDFANNS